MKKSFGETFQKWKNYIITNKKSISYDIGVLLYNSGWLCFRIIPYLELVVLIILLGFMLILLSNKKMEVKVGTIILTPILCTILFIVVVFSGFSLLSIIFLSIALTFPIVYRIITWIRKKQVRINCAFSFLGILLLVKILLFAFSEMEVIRSKIYPDLYLIKNPSSNTDSLRAVIRKIAVDRMNHDFIGNESSYKDYNNDSSRVWLYYELDFYEYTNGGFEGGTSYFIENEQDNGGGFSDNTLADHHKDAQIARFSIDYFDNDTINYFATLTYYKNEKEIKVDTIINKSIR